MAFTCDPSTLPDQARCFNSCISPGFQAGVQTYLLAKIAFQLGAITSVDPQVLQTAASAYLDISDPMAVQNMLLCLLNS